MSKIQVDIEEYWLEGTYSLDNALMEFLLGPIIPQLNIHTYELLNYHCYSKKLKDKTIVGLITIG